MCHSKHRRHAPIVIVNPQAVDTTASTTMYGYQCTCGRRRCRCGGVRYTPVCMLHQQHPASMVGVVDYSSQYYGNHHHCHHGRRGPISGLIGGVVGLVGYAAQKHEERKQLKNQTEKVEGEKESPLSSSSSSRASASSLSSSRTSSSTSQDHVQAPPTQREVRTSSVNKPSKASQREQSGQWDETVGRVAEKEWDEHQRSVRGQEQGEGDSIAGPPPYRP